MQDLDKICQDIRELEDKVERVAMTKIQVFGNEFINIYFLRSGFSANETERYYYVIIENDKNPIPPTLMTPSEIKEKLNLEIDDYY